MRKTSLLRTGAVLLGISLVAAACGGDDDDDAGATTSAESTETTASSETTAATETTAGGGGGARGNVDGTLKIGTLLPETGSLNVIVESLRVPIEIAIEEINDAGGVLGNPVETASGDDGTNGDVLIPSVDRLLEADKVDAIVGPAPSGAALNILDKLKSGKAMACSGSTTSAALSTADSGGYYFRTAPPDKLQGPALAELIVGDGYSNVAIVTRNDSYGVGFGEAVAEALEGAGASVAINAAYDPDGTNYSAEVSNVVAAGPDAVVVIGFNDDGAKIVSEMIAQNVGPAQIPIYTADGMQSSSFGETVDASNPGVVAGIKGTAPAASPEGITHPFADAFAEAGVDPIFSAYFYDCTILTALAAEAAGSDDAEAMKDAFAANLSGDNDCQTFAECKEFLANGETIHYRGASNNFDKWDGFEPAAGTYDIWEYNAEAGVDTLSQTSIEV